MASILESKKKAIEFLLKSLETPWILEALDNDPLRFEAHTYLANKGLIDKSDWGRKIIEIWDSWIEDKGLPPPKLPPGYELRERGRFFWPAVDRYVITTGDTDNADWEPGCDIENHVSMFRTKETFGIPGYERCFLSAKRELSKNLRSDNLLESEDNIRLLWQIIRSPFLRTVLRVPLRSAAQEIIEEKVALIDRSPLVIDESLSRLTLIEIFFLLSTNLEDDYFHIAKFFLTRSINTQRRTGSFRDDIVETCLYLCSAYLSGIDPNGIVRDRALGWLQSKQADNGCWRSYNMPFVIKTDNIEAEDILRTVIVLETIDLVTKDKPLPNWAESMTPEIEANGTRESQTDRLPIPKNIFWEDVSIRFISDESVEIRAGTPLGVKNFIELGFKDRRSDKPDYKWEALKLLAKNGGEISWKDKSASLKWKPHIKTLRKRLRNYFDIQDDPFYSYRRSGGYKTKFSISYRKDPSD